jgi:hypothetical protein
VAPEPGLGAAPELGGPRGRRRPVLAGVRIQRNAREGPPLPISRPQNMPWNPARARAGDGPRVETYGHVRRYMSMRVAVPDGQAAARCDRSTRSNRGPIRGGANRRRTGTGAAGSLRRPRTESVAFSMPDGAVLFAGGRRPSRLRVRRSGAPAGLRSVGERSAATGRGRGPGARLLDGGVASSGGVSPRRGSSRPRR